MDEETRLRKQLDDADRMNGELLQLIRELHDMLISAGVEPIALKKARRYLLASGLLREE